MARLAAKARCNYGSEQESDGCQAGGVLTAGEISVHSAVCETTN